MYLKSIELSGFKSFAKKSTLTFSSPIAGIVGPNGSGKSNTAEAFRFVLGEQSMKALRGKRGPDLIWVGNDKQPQANRARVALTFDNRDRIFDIDFDELVLERVVHRDGAHEYFLNGSTVRLKDITELLAKAHIGSTGHHIISQGEADRILGASLKERREMIEDALGLKTYHVKKAESVKKLERTAENMKEAKLLERELKPQLDFLSRQLKKLERARTLKREVLAAYATYITHERRYIATETRTLELQSNATLAAIARTEEALQEEENAQNDSPIDTTRLDTIDAQLREVAIQKSSLAHTKGRLEGQLAALENTTHTQETHNEPHVPYRYIKELLDEVALQVEQAHTTNDTSFLHNVVASVRSFLERFEAHDKPVADTQPMRDIEQELAKTNERMDALEAEEAALSAARKDAVDEQNSAHDAKRQSQERYYELKDELRVLTRTRDEQARALEMLARTKNALVALEHRAQDRGLGHIPLSASLELPARETQEETLREIERLEARLDETGGVDESVVHEHKELEERAAFVGKELEDLEASQRTLEDILEALEEELATRFEDGLAKINSEFGKFFSMLFNGGHAELLLVEERTEEGEDGEVVRSKPGIEVRVQLPRKKVTTLDVLSGGERALTSIALIFAMSQVNPPPFIILDETDAALDEANSRRYADMVRELSKRSQLILITHNRQTMEAAGELYGVTMGGDGISKLLSVKFDEAVSVAK